MERVWGFILIIISAASFGAMAIFGVYAYDDGIDTISLLFLRFLIASIIMLSSMLIMKKAFPKGKTLIALILLGVLGYGGQSFSFFTALTLIPASLVAILLYLYPSIVTILSTIFLKEKITGSKLIALILTLVGTVLVVGIKQSSNLTGIFFGVMAAVIYSIYIVVGSKVTKPYGAFASSCIIITAACVLYSVVVSIRGLTLPTSSMGWLFAVLIAVVCTVIAIVTFFAGVKRIGAVNGSMLSTFEPVVTVLLATLFLGEITGPMQYLGMGFILTGALLLSREKKVPIRVPEDS